MAEAIPHLGNIGAMLQTARDLTLEAANNVAARLIEDTPIKPAAITEHLNSRTERDRLAGLRQIVSLMCKGNDAVSFFPDVIKNVASSNFEIRKLVYMYLVRYAAYEPDLSLLSINTIQKSLSDDNPVIRALALRVISSIRVQSIVQIICLGIKKCTTDPSPIVRRSAAAAISKCFDINASNGPALLENLKTLLADRNPRVVGSALVTLSKTFPDRIDILHKVYRKICSQLPAMDEWGQNATLDILLKYARVYLRKPELLSKTVAAMGQTKGDYEQFDDEEEQANSSVEVTTDFTGALMVESDHPVQIALDPDLDLLFNSVYPLLFSRNGSVVISAAKIYFYLGIPKIFEDYRVAGHVVELLRGDLATQYIALINIKIMALARPSVFYRYIKNFFVLPGEMFLISKLKLEILTLLCTKDNANLIVSELKYYSLTSPDPKTISESVQAIGRCITSDTDSSSKILLWLLRQIASPDSNPSLVSESLNVVRFLVLRNPKNHVITVARLAKMLDKVKVASAKSSLIWLVGEFVGVAPDIAPDVLRKCLKQFAQEESATVRYQIVLLASKLYSWYLDRKREQGDIEEDGTIIDDGNIVPKLYSYTMQLARYDDDYDTRDRTRMFSSLLNSPKNTELATLLLQAPKGCPITSLRDILCGTAFSEKTKLTVKSLSALPKSKSHDYEQFGDSDSEEAQEELESESEEELSSQPSEITPLAKLTLGSTSLVLGHPVDGYQSLPEWTPLDQPLLADPSVRDEDELNDTATTTTSASRGGKFSNLNNLQNMAPNNGTRHRALPMRASSSSSSFSSNATLPVYANGGRKLKEQTLDEFFSKESSSEESSDESQDDDETSEEESSSGEEEESSSEEEGSGSEEESEEGSDASESSSEEESGEESDENAVKDRNSSNADEYDSSSADETTHLTK